MRIASRLLLLVGFALNLLAQQRLPAQAVEAAPPAKSAASFDGHWDSTFGPLKLTQDQQRIVGVYANEQAHLTGTMQGNRLTFNYREPGEAGEAWFELAGDGTSFRGKYRPQGSQEWLVWNGRRSLVEDPKERGFDGLWNSTFGQLRLAEKENQVSGVYTLGSGSSLSGERQGQRLTFKYQEPQAKGEGWFELAADGRSFHGQWQEEGNDQTSTWSGVRVAPVPGRKWLVVLEAHYENNLAEQEYSFGQMLKAFFARTPQVQVRHRFFHDRRDLRKWCEELAYLNEPAVLVIASHGTEKGIELGKAGIGARPIAESLRLAGTLKLLHFSSCEIMGGTVPAEIARRLSGNMRLPISGYATPVDWATSAIIEFLYLDLVLARGLDPQEAEKQIKLLMPLAGDTKLEGAVLPPAGFRLLMP